MPVDESAQPSSLIDLSNISDCIPNLAADGSNWPIYRDRMIFALRAFSLNNHLVNSEAPKPGPEAQPFDEAEAAIRWEREDAIVKQHIAATIPNAAFKRMKEDMSAREVWDDLDAQFKNKSDIIREHLKTSLQNQRCGKKEDVRKYFARMASLREKLATAGGSVPDEEYAHILLRALPEEYENVVKPIKIAALVSEKKIPSHLVIDLITGEYEENIKKQSQNHQRRSRKEGKSSSRADGEGT